jgi:hypothetical protein
MHFPEARLYCALNGCRVTGPALCAWLGHDCKFYAKRNRCGRGHPHDSRSLTPASQKRACREPRSRDRRYSLPDALASGPGLDSQTWKSSNPNPPGAPP